MVPVLQRVANSDGVLLGPVEGIKFGPEFTVARVTDGSLTGSSGNEGSITRYAIVGLSGSPMDAVTPASVLAALAGVTDPVDINGQALVNASSIAMTGGATLYSTQVLTSDASAFAALEFALAPAEAAHVRVVLVGLASVGGLPAAAKFERSWLAVNVFAAPWQALFGYGTGARVTNDGGKVYIAMIGGITGNAGGPTGTGTGIVDGGVTWDYLSSSSIVVMDAATIGADIDSIGLTSPIGIRIDPSGQICQIGAGGKAATTIAWTCSATAQVCQFP